jgi:hypothetical protein
MSDPVLRWVVHRALGLELDLPSPSEWSASLESLSANRLSALAGYLLGARLSELPDPVRAGLSGAHAKALFATQRSGAQLRELAGELAGADFGWVVLKGLPLAERLYPDPVCRPCRDLDLLVPENQLEPAGALLVRLGYRLQPDRHTHHLRYLRPGSAGWDDIVELHWRSGPRAAGSGEAELLASRRLVETRWGKVWIPGPAAELELLIQHYVRHAGWQVILLLDILLQLSPHPRSPSPIMREGVPMVHPLGAALEDDQRRLGLVPRVTGPFRLSHLPLRRWLATHEFGERRTARRTAPVAVALAQRHSLETWRTMIQGLVWPETPSPRWSALAATRPGWRWYRLLTLGRGSVPRA